MAPERPMGIEQERPSFSTSEDDVKDTAPSPDGSDFIIKPTVKEKSSDMKEVESESKKKKMKVNEMSIVLGLPKQNVNVKKLALKNKTNSKQLSESGFLTQTLFKAEKELGTDFMALDFEMSSRLKEQMSGIWIEKFKEIDMKKRRWQQKMLELYIKKLELIGEGTQLVLDQLKSSN